MEFSEPIRQFLQQYVQVPLDAFRKAANYPQMLQKVPILKLFSGMNILSTRLEWKCNIEERWNPMSSCRTQCKAEFGLIPESNYQRRGILLQTIRRFSINQRHSSNKREFCGGVLHWLMTRSIRVSAICVQPETPSLMINTNDQSSILWLLTHTFILSNWFILVRVA